MVRSRDSFATSMPAQRIPDPFDRQPVGWAQLAADVRAAISSDAPVLITGNSEARRIIARVIHDQDAHRASSPFADVDHDTLYDTLASLSAEWLTAEAQPSPSSELVRTLFVDHVDQLTPAAQEMLLYFLDVSHTARLPARGGVAGVRLITASTMDLTERITAGFFRSDLYYRLNVIHLAVPLASDVDESRRLQMLFASL